MFSLNVLPVLFFFFAPSVCFVFIFCTCVFAIHLLQLQEAKQLERERHRQHSPVTQHTEPESPQLHAHIHPPAKGVSQEANGPIAPSTPSIKIPTSPTTPSTPAAEGGGDINRSASEEQGHRREQEEQEAVCESPDPENGSDFCVAENEQTEADQATAAAAAAQSKTDYRVCPIVLKTPLLFSFD